MIGFCGLSHLSIVSALCAAQRGWAVVLFDPDASVRTPLTQGKFPFHEPGLQELFHEVKERVKISGAVQDLSMCDIVYVALDVPTDSSHRSDVLPIEELVQQVVPLLNKDCTLVIHSQIKPGFCRNLSRRLDGELSSRSITLVYQVETLIFGQAISRALHPERYVVGTASTSSSLPCAYLEFLQERDCPILILDFESAELSKIAINLFLVSSLATSHLVGEICEKIGANWSALKEVLQLDKRIGPHAYLNLGLGIGGTNLQRDMRTISDLAEEFGADGRLVDAWSQGLSARKRWLLKNLYGTTQKGSTSTSLAIWGLAYKAHTDSTQGACGYELLQKFQHLPKVVYDPVVRLQKIFPNCKQVESALTAAKDADVLLITTPWPEFSEVHPHVLASLMRGREILDPYGTLDRDECEKAGFRYKALGI